MNYKIEFDAVNNKHAINLIKQPLQISAMQFLSPQKNQSCHILAVSFHNQLNIYQIETESKQTIVILQITIEDLQEEIYAIKDFFPQKILLFGGKLGYLYSYNLQSKQTLQKRGHWSSIINIKRFSFDNHNQMTLTSSSDNSVRLWIVKQQVMVQIGLFLPSLSRCSNVISITSKKDDNGEFATLDLTQTIRIWQIDKQHCSDALQSLTSQTDQFESDHDYLKVQTVSKHEFKEPLQQISDISYIGKMLAMLSVTQGLVIALPTQKNKFQVLKWIPPPDTMLSQAQQQINVQFKLNQQQQKYFYTLDSQFKLIRYNIKEGNCETYSDFETVDQSGLYALVQTNNDNGLLIATVEQNENEDWQLIFSQLN